MNDNTQVKCPNCGTIIDVQDILAHQLEEDIKQKYQAQALTEQKRLDAEKEIMLKEKEAFEQKKKQENELFQDKLQKQMALERREIEEKLKAKLKEENAEKDLAMQKELNEQSARLSEFNRTKVELETMKRRNAEMRESIEAETQKRFNDTLQTEREKIKHAEEEKTELRIRELQKQLDDQKKMTEEMKRKQEQGSMQLQGEVQELAIEEWLLAKFPYDTIEEIKKGARGGDCIQIVHTQHRQNCGKIYYESKRTKDFQAGWIEKFKSDMREKGADIGVLVTGAMPAGFDRMGIKDGVWICTYEEFKGLCYVLRESVIQISLVSASQENRGDKMHLLYDFLTSNAFRMQVEAIVEGFSSMKVALDSEKRAMQRIWKEREKQIEKVICNTIDMYGSIRGIAGNAVQPVSALELPGTSFVDEPFEE